MKIRQHEAIRVPAGWTGQDKALIIQLENIFTDLYKIAGNLGTAMVTAVSYDTTTHMLTITIDGNAVDVAKLASLDTGGKVPVAQLPGVTQSADGIMSAADKTKLDGIEMGANKYILPLAASGIRGGAQVGFTTDGVNRNYAIELDGEKMYVHVPWEDTHQDISGKADKVSGGTANNFAALDSSGNLKDSGHKHSDYLTDIAYDSTNKKITKTSNGSTTDVVSVATLKAALGAFTWGNLANQS